MKKLYNKFAKWMCTIPSDKYAHLIVSLVLVFLFAQLADLVIPNASRQGCLVLGCAMALSVGTIKKEKDFERDGYWTNSDLIADAIGVIMGGMMFWL